MTDDDYLAYLRAPKPSPPAPPATTPGVCPSCHRVGVLRQRYRVKRVSVDRSTCLTCRHTWDTP